ncbi:MAG: nucleoside deaminase [Blastocatellia bacterium]|nr:nucleoside deaminase [Blastocatellia bacterium]
MSEFDEKLMRVALEAAIRAGGAGEVPIGACLVDADGNVLTTAANRTITDSDPTAHAEVLVLRQAASLLNNYRLTGTTVYTTIEPCVMCAGALVNARVQRLVFGARDERFGAVETLFRLCDSELLNHRIEIASGVLADECRHLMQEFFRKRRD